MSILMPRGMMSRREAIDRVGRNLFGVEWSGTEQNAPQDFRSANNPDRQRYSRALEELRRMLAEGFAKALLMDPWSGRTKPIPSRRWYAYGGDRLLDKGTRDGEVLIEAIPGAGAPLKRMSESTIRMANEWLRDQVAVISGGNPQKIPTRSRQKKMVAEHFPGFAITGSQLKKVFQGVPSRIGRPPDSP